MGSSGGRAALWSGLGNLTSKALAFMRNMVLAAAIGTALVADAYNVANNIPNMLFLLLGGGAIATVFVPQITRHARTSQRRADEYSTVLLVAVTGGGLLLVTVLLLLAPHLVTILGGSEWGQAQRDLATTLSYWCLPQVVFYAIYSVQTQVMNSRGKFVAAAWVSSSNSLLVLITCVPILVMGTVAPNLPTSLGQLEVALLGSGALGGTIAQAVWLGIIAIRAGFTVVLPSNLRGLGLRKTGSVAIWTIAASLCYQLSNLVVVAITARAGAEAASLGEAARGYSVYYYAFTLVTLVQSVVIATFGNILLAKMARHRESGDPQAALAELDLTVRRASALVAPMSGLFICIGMPLAAVMFTRGNTSLEDALAIGTSVAILGAGIVPYTLHMLLIRAFYSYMLPRPPMVSAGVVNALWITGAIGAHFLAPARLRAWIVAAVFVVAYWVDLPLKLLRLRSEMGFRISNETRAGLLRLLISGGLSSCVTGIAVAASSQLFESSYSLYVTQLIGGVALFSALHLLGTRGTVVSPIRILRWLRH